MGEEDKKMRRMRSRKRYTRKPCGPAMTGRLLRVSWGEGVVGGGDIV